MVRNITTAKTRKIARSRKVHHTGENPSVLIPKSPAGRLTWLSCGYVRAAIAIALSAAVAIPAFAASAPAVVIKMSDKPPKFLPDKVTIKPGQTVEWINNAKTLHSVDGDPSMALKPSDVSLPSGAKPFDSGFLKPGMSWDYTFKAPGTYKYTCVPHEKDGMNGEVVVR
jgi:plastocyanin